MMSNHIKDKSIIVTGAANGFGKLISEKAAAMGAKITCADINRELLESAVNAINENGGSAQGVICDVSDSNQMAELARSATQAYGSIDVLINNAGIMPLAFFSDHKQAIKQWHKCIDINFKGVVNGIAAVYDQMIAQGKGHIVNISSVYGNHPVAGGGVYSATKSAVNYVSDALRVEARGKIKVTTIKPTGVPATGLMSTAVNPAAMIGILGHYGPDIAQRSQDREAYMATLDHNPDSIGHEPLDPNYIADNILYAINQPWGVVIGDITIRASGDHLIV